MLPASNSPLKKVNKDHVDQYGSVFLESKNEKRIGSNIYSVKYGCDDIIFDAIKPGGPRPNG